MSDRKSRQTGRPGDPPPQAATTQPANVSAFGARAILHCLMCDAVISLPEDRVPLCHSCRISGVFQAVGPTQRIELGDPFAAAKEMGLRITDTDVEWLERRARRPRETVDETLWCEAGGHEWVFPKIPGSRPRSCPLHARDGDAPRAAWPGNSPDCFLVAGHWAVRLFVTAPLLRGSTWHIPSPIGEGLAIDAERALTPQRSALGQRLTIRPRGSIYVGGSLSTALLSANGMEGDFVFVCLAPTSWDLIARRRREVAATDGLGRLLWGCAIDPTDDDARARPWLAVARALGGAEPNRDALRRRLLQRRNFDLVSALDETRALRVASPEPQPEWPSGWEFTAPLVDDPSIYAVSNSNGVVRVALGVADSNRTEDDTLIDGTGIAWKEFRAGAEQAPVTANEPWVRWKRAEHHAIRAALSGTEWRAAQIDGVWRLNDGTPHIDLIDALTAIPVESVGTPKPPETLPRATCPRSGFAHDRLVRRAINQGLLEIAGHPTAGLTATFENGERIEGATLADLFS